MQKLLILMILSKIGLSIIEKLWNLHEWSSMSKAFQRNPITQPKSLKANNGRCIISALPIQLVRLMQMISFDKPVLTV